MAKRIKTWKEYDEVRSRCRNTPKWIQKRTWTLKKCRLTGDLILPGTKAWCKTYYHHYNGTIAFSDWAGNEAYTFELLKGTRRLDGDL